MSSLTTLIKRRVGSVRDSVLEKVSSDEISVNLLRATSHDTDDPALDAVEILVAIATQPSDHPSVSPLASDHSLHF